MNLESTPAEWGSPRGIQRFRSFHAEGYPWLSSFFALGAMPVTVFAVGEVLHALRRGRDYPLDEMLIVGGLAAVCILVCATCLYMAVTRMLRGYDLALELDPQQRRLLVLHAGKANIVSFSSIQALVVEKSTTHYQRSGETVRSSDRYDLLALPGRQLLYVTVGANLMTAGTAKAGIAAMGRDVAKTIGVPLVSS
jgi:hypothetical protein